MGVQKASRIPAVNVYSFETLEETDVFVKPAGEPIPSQARCKLAPL